MFEFFTHLLNAFQNASKRNIVALFAFLFVICIGCFFWERWTASFRLTRLERASGILEHVSHVPGADTNQVIILSGRIVRQLADIIGLEEAPSKKHSFALRLILGFCPWFLLGLLFVPTALRKGKREASAIFGAWAVGIIFAVICAFLPEGQWPWRYLLVYPSISFVVFMGLMVVIALTASTKQKTTVKEG
jgi:hypothetical protein